MKLKVRTNRTRFKDAASLAAGMLRLDELDFSAFSFSASGQSLFSVKEKEKKWVEKQYFLYSDGFRKPFALFNISYRYRVSGRYKEKEEV